MSDRVGDDLVALVPRLRRFARALTGSGADADDLVQAALEKALRSAHQWTPGTKLDSWVFCIVRSVWIDHLRKRTEVAVDGGSETRSQPAVDGVRIVESRLMLEAVRRSFAALSDEQREILHLVCIEGFSYREAAEILGIPIGTVMSRLARARLSLHERLVGYEASPSTGPDRLQARRP
jgi:RNA polymerase sigma-70 factor (ECF subfamily)